MSFVSWERFSFSLWHYVARIMDFFLSTWLTWHYVVSITGTFFFLSMALCRSYHGSLFLSTWLTWHYVVCIMGAFFSLSLYGTMSFVSWEFFSINMADVAVCRLYHGSAFFVYGTILFIFHSYYGSVFTFLDLEQFLSIHGSWIGSPLSRIQKYKNLRVDHPKTIEVPAVSVFLPVVSSFHAIVIVSHIPVPVVKPTWNTCSHGKDVSAPVMAPTPCSVSGTPCKTRSHEPNPLAGPMSQCTIKKQSQWRYCLWYYFMYTSYTVIDFTSMWMWEKEKTNAPSSAWRVVSAHFEG